MKEQTKLVESINWGVPHRIYSTVPLASDRRARHAK